MPQTLEPRIESSLLYRENGIDKLIHDSYFEFFLAKYFADKINSGGLSIKDAYVNFWSYEEDAELWGLHRDKEWRAVLPNWKQVLLFMISMLKTEKAKEMVGIISEDYFKAKKIISKERYNPFLDDFCCGVQFKNVANLVKILPELLNDVFDYFKNEYTQFRPVKIIEVLSWLDSEIIFPFFESELRNQEYLDDKQLLVLGKTLSPDRRIMDTLADEIVNSQSKRKWVIAKLIIYYNIKDPALADAYSNNVDRSLLYKTNTNILRCLELSEGLRKLAKSGNMDYLKQVLGIEVRPVEKDESRCNTEKLLKNFGKTLDSYIVTGYLAKSSDPRVYKELVRGAKGYYGIEDWVQSFIRKNVAISGLTRYGNPESLPIVEKILRMYQKAINSYTETYDMAKRYNLSVLFETRLMVLKQGRDNCIEHLKKLGNRSSVPLLLEIINPIKNIFVWQSIYEDEGDLIKNKREFYQTCYDAVYAIHQRLKPQGYNPAVKRLAS